MPVHICMATVFLKSSIRRPVACPQSSEPWVLLLHEQGIIMIIICCDNNNEVHAQHLEWIEVRAPNSEV